MTNKDFLLKNSWLRRTGVLRLPQFRKMSVAIAIGTTLLYTLIYSHPSLGQTFNNSDSALQQQHKHKSLEITSLTHDGVETTITPGTPLKIKLEGTAGGNASILLVGDKQTVREIPAKEVSPGVYLAAVDVTGYRFVEGAIIGRLQAGRQVVYKAIPQAIGFQNEAEVLPDFPIQSNLVPSNSNPENTTAAARNDGLRPVFISHQDGELVEQQNLTLRGQTQPHAEVQIQVTSSLSVLGAFVTIEGDTLLDQIVTADSKGNFEVVVPQTSKAPSGLKYTVNAIASLAGKTSEPAQLTLVQK